MKSISEIQPDTVAYIPATDVSRSWRDGEAIVNLDPERITYRPYQPTDIEIVRHVAGDTEMFTVIGSIPVRDRSKMTATDEVTRRFRLAIWETA